MYITMGDLAAYCGVSTWCVRAYLDRGEFNKCRTDKKYLWNMTEEQMEHLKELVHNRNGAKRNTYNTIKEDC